MPVSTPPSPKSDTSSTIGDKRALALRYLALFVGLCINSFGISLIAKSALGTSPISSVPYVLSLRFAGLSFGMFSFIVNIVFIAVQIALQRRDFRPIDFLQLVVNVVFSSCIDISTALLGWLDPANLVVQILCVVLGSAILAFGVSLEVAPDVVMVPGEGVVRAIARVSGKPFATIKNCFDLSLVGIALVLSFVFFGELRGLGLGTIISAMLVGRLCSWCNMHVGLIERVRQLGK